MFDEKILDEMILDGDKIAVGVSGGADSMFLLHLLLKKKSEINFYIKVIHVNHHLRDSESERDKDFVKSFCENKNISSNLLFKSVRYYIHGKRRGKVGRFTEHRHTNTLLYQKYKCN